MRFSSVRGMPVIDIRHEETVGWVSDILIHPDTGKIEGFFIVAQGLLGNRTLFLSVSDIVHVGTHIGISHGDALAPVEDRIRLQPLFEQRRPILGQRIQTESGRKIGRCKDIQFDTEKMRLEWLFPSRFFFQGTAIPIAEVLEVRANAIIIRDQEVAAPEVSLRAGEPIMNPLKEVTEPSLPQPSRIKEYEKTS